MQLAASGVEGTLLIVGAVVNGGTTKFMDGLSEEPLHRKLAERLVVMQITDDFAAETPEVVHVVANGFR